MKPHGLALRIVTNNLNVVRLLAGKEDFEVTVTGGILRHRDHAITGAAATAFVERYRLDYSILGVVAIDATGAILDFHADEEPLTRAVIGCGRQCFVVADSSKFGRNAIEHQVTLYVTYSISKEDCAMSSIPLAAVRV